jgi:electron transport complex protein RnfC
MIKVNELFKTDQEHIESITSAFIPPIAVVSLSQDTSTVLSPSVSIGDTVLEGQIIGKDSERNACIHSPIPGTVTDIFTASMPNGKRIPSISIKLNGAFNYLGKKTEKASWIYSPATQRLKQLCEMGVINTFDVPATLSKQMEPVLKKQDGFLAIRLFDKDPSVQSETCTAEQYVNEILEGAALIADTINASSVFFLYGANNWYVPQDTDVKMHFKSTPVYFIPVETSLYPQGGIGEVTEIINKYLQKNFKKKTGSIVLAVDGSTALASYNAIVKNIPYIEKIVHVAGDCIKKHGMYKVRLGTPIRNLLQESEGFVSEPAKIVINGLIKGIAVSDLNTPITKYVNSITVLSAKDFPDQRQTPCIRCGRCHEVCPASIQPEKFYFHYFSDVSIPRHILNTSALCTECALCNAVCPSRLPLYQTIKLVQGKND